MLIIIQTLGWFLFLLLAGTYFFISDFLLPTLNTQLIVRINLTEFNRNICCRGKCEFSFFFNRGAKVPEPPQGHKWQKVIHDNKVWTIPFFICQIVS